MLRPEQPWSKWLSKEYIEGTGIKKIRDDAPEDVKIAYKEYIEERERRFDQGKAIK